MTWPILINKFVGHSWYEEQIVSGGSGATAGAERFVTDDSYAGTPILIAFTANNQTDVDCDIIIRGNPGNNTRKKTIRVAAGDTYTFAGRLSPTVASGVCTRQIVGSITSGYFAFSSEIIYETRNY